MFMILLGHDMEWDMLLLFFKGSITVNSGILYSILWKKILYICYEI